MRESPKILILSLHVNPMAEPGRDNVGGLGVYVLNKAKYLVDLGYRVDIVTVASKEPLSPEKDLPLEQGFLLNRDTVDELPGINVFSSPQCAFEENENIDRLSFYFAKSLADKLDFSQYDLIHAHYWSSAPVALYLRSFFNIPIFYTAHTWQLLKPRLIYHSNYGDSPSIQIRLNIERRILKESDALIVNSNLEKKEVESKYHINSDRILVFSPGVNSAIFYPADKADQKQKLGLAVNTKYFLYVGRIQPSKAPDFAISVFARFLTLYGDAEYRLIIIGASNKAEQDYFNQLRIQVERLGITDKVVFIDPLTPSKLTHYYQAADLALVPSYSETYGFVILEAQATATPVISSTLGGMNSLVENNHTGIVVKSYDIDQWASAINELLSSPDYYRSIQTKGLDFARQFNWQSQIKVLDEIYRGVLARFDRKCDKASTIR